METLKINKTEVWLKRLARFSAWALLAGVVVLIVSGWGITQTGVIYRLSGGHIDRRLADQIHRDSNGPLAFFFLCHVLVNIRLMITRRRPSRALLTDITVIVFGVGLMVIMVYMEYIRRGG